MHAKTFQQQTQQPQNHGGDRPLATSAFSGEARLRELEHLAETARKVRDQAAAELTRSGSTHHIARDRIAAAERMLRKSQQEIAELRAQLGPAARTATAIQPPKPQDFELAVLLGHSKARFNRDAAAESTYEIQQDSPTRGALKRPAHTGTQRNPAGNRARADERQHSAWRTFSFAALLGIGISLGAAGTYFLVTTGSFTEAAQVVRQGTSQLVGKVRALLPSLSTPGLRGQSATANATLSQLDRVPPAAPSTSDDNAQKTQEQQLRAAAEQRLARQIAGLEKPHL